MLSKKNRIKKNEEFKIIHRQGNFFSFGNICLSFKKNEKNITRVGVSVGLNFSKKAVVRNLIKRRTREIFRKKLGKIKKGFDLVITIKKNKEEKISSHSLEKSLEEVLKKANLIVK